MNVPDRNQIKIGSHVWIETKQNQDTGKLTEGTVKEILTHAESHPHGIKVNLEDDQTGRVKKIDSVMEFSSAGNGFVDLYKIEIPRTEDKENEFKETFQYDKKMANHIQNEQAIEGMKYNGPVELARAICSLGNSYSGGFVFLGVADNGDIIGLEKDKKLGKFTDYKDKFANHMRDKLESLLTDKAFFADKIQIVFRIVGGKTICIIQVLPANKPLHVKIKSRDEFYARGPTARAQHMTGDDLIRYTRGRFPNYN